MTGTLWTLTGPEPRYKRPRLTGSRGPGPGVVTAAHFTFYILPSSVANGSSLSACAWAGPPCTMREGEQKIVFRDLP